MHLICVSPFLLLIRLPWAIYMGYIYGSKIVYFVFFQSLVFRYRPITHAIGSTLNTTIEIYGVFVNNNELCEYVGVPRPYTAFGNSGHLYDSKTVQQNYSHHRQDVALPLVQGGFHLAKIF